MLSFAHRYLIIACLFGFGLLLSACGEPLTSLPTDATAELTLATTTPIVPAVGDNTPIASTPVAAEPTITTIGPPADTPTPAPTPTGQIGPDNFPAGINPVTGLPVADPTALNRRPLLIKISNSPDCVRPQSGISQADLAFEHYAEGGTTRLTALFWTHTPSRVGSVRSARMIDLELPAMYQALFAFSGSSDGLHKRIADIDFFPYVLSPDHEPGFPGFFRRPINEIRCELIEHTLYVNPRRLWEEADARTINQPPAVAGMVFNSVPPAGGLPATDLTVRYTGSYVYWGYSDASGVYFRSNNGARHMDELTGTQVSAANVVVLYVNHVTSDIIEDFVGYNPNTGTGGNYSVEIQLWGSGDALLLRDGQAYPIKWIRTERNRPFNLTDAAGNLIPLKPGITWYQLVALDSPTTQNGAEWDVVPTRPDPQPTF